MPKIAFLLMFSLVGFLNVAFAQQECAPLKGSAWSKQLSDAFAECDNRFMSPDGKLLLRIDSKGKIRISKVASGRQLQAHSYVVEPPAMFSWAPRSDAFFIDDGEGSGMSSNFRLFRIRNDRTIEDRTVRKRAVGMYRRLTKCKSAVDPNTWGFGWSTEGGSFYLLIQSTVDEPCGRPDHFMSITVRLSDDSILEQLSAPATQRKFHDLLPPELLR